MASRVAAGRKDGGRVLLQTHSANHKMFSALTSLNFDLLMSEEAGRRKSLRLPPFGALAHISGVGTTQFAGSLSETLLVSVATLAPDDVVVRAASVNDLVSTLKNTAKPKGSRLKIQIDPPRI